MENKNNQHFNGVNQIVELNKLKILNSTLIKELRKYMEENAKLQQEKETLYGKIEKLEKENKTLKSSDFSSMESQNPHEETMEIVENVPHSNHEIKEEPLDYNDLEQKSSNSEAKDNTFSDISSMVDQNPHEETMEIVENVLYSNIEIKEEPLEYKDYKCEHCDESFSKEGILKEHIYTAHKGLKCCKKTFAQAADLDRHNHNVHKPHKCEICEKEIIGKCHLKVHMENVHEGLMKYKCGNCGLKRHIASVHEKIQLNCDQCSKTFSTEGNLKRHLQKFH